MHVGHEVAVRCRFDQTTVVGQLRRDGEHEVLVLDGRQVDLVTGEIGVATVEVVERSVVDHRAPHPQSRQVHHRVADVRQLEIEQGGDPSGADGANWPESHTTTEGLTR